MTKVFVNLGGKRRLGIVQKVNHYTLWVRIMMGARTSIVVKRKFIRGKFNRDKVRLSNAGL